MSKCWEKCKARQGDGEGQGVHFQRVVREGPSAEVTFGKKPAYGEKVSHFINTKFWANSTRASRIVFESKISTPGILSSKVRASTAAWW